MIDFTALFKNLFGKKASRGFVWMVFIFYLLADKGPAWIEVLKKEKFPPQPIMGVSTSVDQSHEEPAPQAKQDNCLSYLPVQNIDINTEFDQIKERDGSYYPTGKGGTWEGMVWITQELNPSFKNIFIEYEIVSDDTNNKPPAFTWSIARTLKDGTRQFIAKSWVPEYSETNGEDIPQLFGYAKNVDYTKNELKREPSESLPDAVKAGQLDSFRIESTGISGNEMMVNFVYNYTSNSTGVALPFTLQKKNTISIF